LIENSEGESSNIPSRLQSKTSESLEQEPLAWISQPHHNKKEQDTETPPSLQHSLNSEDPQVE